MHILELYRINSRYCYVSCVRTARRRSIKLRFLRQTKFICTVLTTTFSRAVTTLPIRVFLGANKSWEPKRERRAKIYVKRSEKRKKDWEKRQTRRKGKIERNFLVRSYRIVATEARKIARIAQNATRTAYILRDRVDYEKYISRPFVSSILCRIYEARSFGRERVIGKLSTARHVVKKEDVKAAAIEKMTGDREGETRLKNISYELHNSTLATIDHSYILPFPLPKYRKRKRKSIFSWRLTSTSTDMYYYHHDARARSWNTLPPREWKIKVSTFSERSACHYVLLHLFASFSRVDVFSYTSVWL